MHNQHNSYWWPGVKSPGHQHPQYWLCIHHTGPISYKNVKFTVSNIRHHHHTLNPWNAEVVSQLAGLKCLVFWSVQNSMMYQRHLTWLQTCTLKNGQIRNSTKVTNSWQIPATKGNMSRQYIPRIIQTVHNLLFCCCFVQVNFTHIFIDTGAIIQFYSINSQWMCYLSPVKANYWKSYVISKRMR